ncbi:MAG: STAS domain-containing protein [Cellvibrionaceae bacterium]|nr:STAS domain-containing protein [Cellvibrionaceae bacterium]
MARVLEYHLPSDCSIAQALDLQRELTKLLRARTAVSVTLHADAVRKIDAVGVQVLYAFLQALAERKSQLQWMAPSERLCNAVRLLGMQQLLNLS